MEAGSTTPVIANDPLNMDHIREDTPELRHQYDTNAEVCLPLAKHNDHSSVIAVLSIPVHQVCRTVHVPDTPSQNTPTIYILTILIFGCIVGGTTSIMSVKFCNNQYSIGQDGLLRKFDHPVFQTLLLFTSQMSFLVVFQLTPRNQKIQQPNISKGKLPTRWIHFLAPALFDCTSTVLGASALILTHASVYQMLCGTNIVYTSILSTVILYKRYTTRQWCGILCIITGLGCIALSSTNIEKQAPDPVMGSLLVLIAQLFTAFQVITEEILFTKLDTTPSEVVGKEATYGLIMTLLMAAILYYIPGDGSRGGNHYENIVDAFYQVANNYLIVWGSLATFLSCALVNYCTMALISGISAIHGTIIRNSRTCLVFLVSICIGWQGIHPFQIVGLLVYAIGVYLYFRST
jgi:drug/metabolite transporter (DMT)-like permease